MIGIEFTQEEIDAFLEECGKKPQFTLSAFTEVLKKDIIDLSYRDVRILFNKMGMLSDNERYKYRNILIYENLTEDEREKYHSIYPERTGGGKFPRYFPNTENVEENYSVYFKSGRSDGGDE